MSLCVHNTSSGRKEEFRPLQDDHVGMYVCGVTVYDDCHIGHARSYVAFDVIRRYLMHKGYKVTYVQNFTDVDDKIIARAQERGISPLILAEEYIGTYFQDTDRLNLLRADHYPKASEYIEKMQHVIKALIMKKHAYEVDGSVYFSIETAADKFGQLRHQSLDDMLDGARVEVDDRKRNPKDFALWKSAKPGEISWDSPWGKGRPGWHIECSTMSSDLLGNTLDIHGGGMDLIFPHHESEILESECYTGVPFVNYWLHNGFLNIDQEKMSKSLGNFFTVKDIYKRFDPMVLRFFLVYTHYRSPIEFSDVGLEEAKNSFQRLMTFRERLSDLLVPSSTNPGPDNIVDSKNDISLSDGPPVQEIVDLVEETRKEFMRAMDDDFNTREAVAALFTMVTEGNRYMNSIENMTDRGLSSLALLMETLDTLAGEILGLKLERDENPELQDSLTPKLVELLIEVRKRARAEKNWSLADHIRDSLKEMGVHLEDDGKQTRWKIV